jgi:hypothetical protein
MQIIADIRERAQHLVEENATTLLTAGGVVGVVTTSILSWRGGYKVGVLARSVESNEDAEMSDDARLMTKLEKAIKIAPEVLPPLVSGSLTVTAIIFSHKMNAQKAAALAAAYGLSQKQFEEYRGKLSEKLGPKKSQDFQDELAQDRVNNTPGSTQIVVVDGEVLCFDQPTGRYFQSTMERINQAVNSTNAEILNHDTATASYFYEELGLPATTWTDDVGWNTDHLVELKISTVLAENNKPCLAIDFATLPKLDYVPRHY